MKLIIATLFIFFSFALQAQTVTISEDIPIRNDKFYAVVGKMENRFLIFRDKSNKFEVQAFDEKLRLSWDKEITLDKRNPQVLAVIPKRDQFSIVYKAKYKGKAFVKIHVYDAAANLMDSATVVNYGNRMLSPNSKVMYSEDRNALLVYHTEQQSELEAWSFQIDKMELVWNKKISLSDVAFSRDFQQMVLDNEGGLYHITERENRKSSLEEHHFLVYQVDAYNSHVSQYEIPLKDVLSYDVHFTFDNLNRQLVAAGLYSVKNRGRASGYYFLKIDARNPDNQLLKTDVFDDDFINNLNSKSSDTKRGVTDIAVQEIVLRRDGGMLIIAEMKRELERQSSSVTRYSRDNYTPYIVDYYYDDICLISIHPDGKTHWKNVLHKKQYSQDDDASFSSFFILKTPRNLRFIFNDEIKDDNTVSEYVVTANGEADRNSVMSTESQDIRLRFRDAMQVGSREMIIPSERRNRLKLVRVRY